MQGHEGIAIYSYKNMAYWNRVNQIKETALSEKNVIMKPNIYIQRAFDIFHTLKVLYSELWRHLT